MIDILRSILDPIADRSPKELIGAVMISLALSLAAAGLYALRRRKASDRFMLMVVLVLFANVGSMTLIVGYLAHAQNRYVKDVESVSHSRPPGPPGLGLELHLSQRILDLADSNRDGSLSSQEATDAAAQFVRTAATQGGEARLDVSTLAKVMNVSLMPPPRPMGPAPHHPQFGLRSDSRKVGPPSIE